MSEKLLEQNFMTFDLRTLGRASNETAAEETEERADEGEEETAASEAEENSAEQEESATEEQSEEPLAELAALPGKGEWDKWKKLLDDRLESNSKLSATEKKTEYEVESKFFREFFVENWDRSIGAKLLLLGEPLRKAIKVLGFNPTKNPILGFINQKRVIDNLIYTGKLNVETFKAIYNAVANRLIAHSELINEKAPNFEYNIIYCPDLYSKSVKEMLDYLKLQSKILKVDKSEYTAEDQLANKRAFLDVGDKVKEQEENKRATEINKLSYDSYSKLQVANAKLNTLTLAELINGKVHTPTTALDGKEQDKLVASLVTPADKFAALLLLALTTQNTEAQNAIKNPAFNSLSSDDKISAAMELSAKGIMPKGQLNKKDTETVVAKILASLPKAA